MGSGREFNTMKEFKNILFTLLGVIIGISLYVYCNNLKQLLTIVIIWLAIAYTPRVFVKCLFPYYSWVAMVLIEIWILMPILITSVITYVSIRITSQALENFLGPISDKEKGAIAGLLNASVVVFVTLLWPKDNENSKSYFQPSGLFRDTLEEVFKNKAIPTRDTLEYDAIWQERVRGNGPIGWGFKARWDRFFILRNYL